MKQESIKVAYKELEIQDVLLNYLKDVCGVDIAEREDLLFDEFCEAFAPKYNGARIRQAVFNMNVVTRDKANLGKVITIECPEPTVPSIPRN